MVSASARIVKGFDVAGALRPCGCRALPDDPDPCSLADHEDVRLITLLGGPIRTMSVDSLSLGR
jgi:hypothetical protein